MSSIFDNPFGGLFDFNGDGVEDLGEQWLAFKVFEEATKKDEDDTWRLTCEDGMEFGVDPDDFETEEEYEEALDEAKYAWGNVVGIGADSEEREAAAPQESSGIGTTANGTGDSSDGKDRTRVSGYPNVRQRNAAVRLAECKNGTWCIDPQVVEKRCRFILEENSTVIAANYLTADGQFLYSQAIKDHFDIPVALPNEDEEREFSLYEIVEKLQRKHVQLALNVWGWCVEQFLPYADYSLWGRAEMTSEIISEMVLLPDAFNTALHSYLNDHAAILSKIVREADQVPARLDILIVGMIKDGFPEAATALFEDALNRYDGAWRKINSFMKGLISYAKNSEELETMEFIEQHFLPRISRYEDRMILDEMEIWQQTIDRYKSAVEQCSEKYAYSRGNAWRRTVPDGKMYDLDPRWYSSEQEYMEALEERKYGWRKWYAGRDTAGLDPADYETQEEFRNAYNEQMRIRRQKEQEQRDLEWKKKEQAREAERAALAADKTIYTYCGVLFPGADHPYSYLSDVEDIQIGDIVLVPVGERGQEMAGEVVSVGRYARLGVPFPVEKAKHIRRVLPKES